MVDTESLSMLGLDDTAPRTESAEDCTAGDRLALGDAETTASTSAAAVEAAELDRVVPLPCDVVLPVRPASMLVCAATNVAPVAPASCCVTDATAADTLPPAAVRFTGGDGGRATPATEKVLSRLTLMPVTPALASAALKLDAKPAGSMLARPDDTAVAAVALMTAAVHGTTTDVDSSSRREVPVVMPDMFTVTALAGSCSWTAVTLAKVDATGAVNAAGELKPPSVTVALTV